MLAFLSENNPDDILIQCYRFIPPLLPYAVVTVDHSISEGGYMFLWPMMRQSVGGLYHAFLTASEAGDSVWEFRELLRRIIAFFHSHFVLNMEETGGFLLLSSS